MRQERFAVELTTTIPELTGMLEGVLYVSEPYGVASHLCACGCGSETVTPLGPGGWSLNWVDGKATLNPSIGNFQIPCRSHYWIQEGTVRWA